jgi:hypothetical protein
MVSFGNQGIVSVRVTVESTECGLNSLTAYLGARTADVYSRRMSNNSVSVIPGKSSMRGTMSTKHYITMNQRRMCVYMFRVNNTNNNSSTVQTAAMGTGKLH